jgi:methyl-accepting chemotaxis protein
MAEITAASVEQSAGIDQVNQAVTSMDEVTQQNAALVEEAAAAAESLVEQAASLIDTVSAFKLQGTLQKNKHLRTISPPAQLRGNATLKLVDHTEEAKFSFNDAREAHTKWKNRLIDYIAGRSKEHLDVDKVCRDDQCPLGGWIYGQAKKFAHMPEYRELKTAHAEFHQGLGDIVRSVHNQKQDEAKKMLGGDFSKTSKRTITAISNIEAKVK